VYTCGKSQPILKVTLANVLYKVTVDAGEYIVTRASTPISVETLARYMSINSTLYMVEETAEEGIYKVTSTTDEITGTEDYKITIDGVTYAIELRASTAL